MTQIGTVTGQEIKTNRDGGVEVRMLQIPISSDVDVQSVQLYPMSGDDSPPMNTDKVIIVSVGDAFQIAVGVQDSVVPSMKQGEKKLYSRTIGGAISAFINFLTGGNLELNGNAYSAVRFQELQTAFDQLKSDFDTHVHGGVTAGGANTSITTPSTADITPAESETVKLK